MNRTALTLAAALGFAAAAGPARADHDGGYDHDRREYAVPVPAPAYAPSTYVAPTRHWRVARWEGWRARELRDEYRRLDLARDRFYATWHGEPWRRDRFEAWYGARRAELDTRRDELAHWHDHGRW
jgi:hypothetical protein